jgi:hypothetical protein
MNNPESRTAAIIAERHNYALEEHEARFAIKKIPRGNQAVQMYLFFSSGIIVLGMIIAWYFSMRWGGFVASLSLPLWVAAFNLRQRNRDALRKSFEISPRGFEFREGYKLKRVPLAEFATLQGKLTPANRLWSGCLYLKTHSNMTYEILEIYGNEKGLIEADLGLLANYLEGYVIPNANQQADA